MKVIRLSDFEYEQLLIILGDFSGHASWNDGLAAKIGKAWIKKLLGKLEASPPTKTKDGSGSAE
jgi:hypothetical protein